MDIRHLEAAPTAAERAAVDALLGPPPSGWQGADLRSTLDTRVATVGRRAREQRHLLLPALDAVQSQIGWISEGALGYVCRRLTVPPAEAYSVASFYDLLSVEKRPPIVLHVCDDICCDGRGAEAIIERLESEIGPEGVAQGEAMWLRSPCLGHCDRAPAVFVQRAGRSDLIVAPADPESLFARAGTDELTPGPIPTVDEYRASGGYSALARAFQLGPDGVIDEVRASNLRGRGGAAFPTGVKWQAVAGSAEPVRYLVCNATPTSRSPARSRTARSWRRIPSDSSRR